MDSGELTPDSPRRQQLGRVFIVVIVLCFLLPLSAFVWPLVQLVVALRSPDTLDQPQEYHLQNGDSLRARMGRLWPASVHSKHVMSTDCRKWTARDSYCSWYRIQLCDGDGRTAAQAAQAADKWAVHIHQREQDHVQWLSEMGGYSPEHLTRIRRCQDLPAARSESPPDWWASPDMEFQVTEVMIWYDQSEFGTARAAGTAFDPAEKTLWISLWCRQHHQLWRPGTAHPGMPKS